MDIPNSVIDRQSSFRFVLDSGVSKHPRLCDNHRQFCFHSCRIRFVIIGNSVETISNGAFYDCRDLESVTFTPGSTDYQIVLGSDVFNNTPLASQFDEGVITIPSTSPNDNYTVTASSYPFPTGIEVRITDQDPIIVNPESSSNLGELDPTNLSLDLLDAANQQLLKAIWNPSSVHRKLRL